MAKQSWIIHKRQYTFERYLGNGSFGFVYAAHRQPDNRLVAVKVVSLNSESPDRARRNSESVVNEFQKARELTKTTDHIVRMFDVDFDPQLGVAYLVMELGQQDFEKYLAQRPYLLPATRKHIWRQLMEIAVTLHRAQIVHRDIKPLNLIMFPGDVIKLGDLGIAKRVLQITGRTGSRPYSAPEVTSAQGSTVLTTKTDVWSYGAVLYRMTYMARPPLDEPYHRPPTDRRTSHDTNLLDVLRHTLVKTPEDRASVAWLAKHAYTTTN
ncbi:unnamed protein product [Adineta ricciae]|uniref:Protein kinase domain-containing protein n=1 Tax=Adineta ricciae TaxID=249248 RepID=A0A815ICZ6_ADIRI|nr:unnamed protein product [Adineta ricciae]